MIYDNLIKVLNFICSEFTYTNEVTEEEGGLKYEYDTMTNELAFWFADSMDNPADFQINISGDEIFGNHRDLVDFLRFLNQPATDAQIDMLKEVNQRKEFKDVWNRDIVYFHASFSTSKRKFIGTSGDFYPNLTLLYPPPTNKSTFYI